MILDKTAVDFLLSLNTNNRNVNPERVAKLAWSIHNVGWKTCESLCVTQFSKLGNGQHRLFALQNLGYPDATATVVFGVDDETVLTLDQHQRRTAKAAIKIKTGESFTNTQLAVVRCGMACYPLPGRMTVRNISIAPEQIEKRLPNYSQWWDLLPCLFSRKKTGASRVCLTAAMTLAVVQYAQRAGADRANDFLDGFFGHKAVLSNSPELKAFYFCLGNCRTGGGDGQTYQYRVFVYLLIAHFEGRSNPQVREAASWGVLQTEPERLYGRKNHA